MPRPGAFPADDRFRASFNKDDLLSRVGGSEELMREVIGLFIDDAPRLLEDIRAKVAAGDGPAIYRATHALKGAAGNFGAQPLLNVAQRLEARALEGDITTSVTVFAALEAEVHALVLELADEQSASGLGGPRVEHVRELAQ